MGKNQAYKAMQRARLGGASGGPDEVEDGMVDGSFHSPEWHAARLASLKTSHTITWEEYKKKQKVAFYLLDCTIFQALLHLPTLTMPVIVTLQDQYSFVGIIRGPREKALLLQEEELKKGELEADADRMMREYRAQLDAERARKLSQGRNHSSSKSKHSKDKRDKISKKHSSKKRKDLPSCLPSILLVAADTRLGISILLEFTSLAKCGVDHWCNSP
ncbi:hypothetical protein L195_g002887 [Trifolium pratense]|uniref:Uncharacterized protein n=2 Tax=Trifolium pratense TaxID=57577 RepID=A0A2K3NTR7_TRIPR|nr:hypothetical protein L195_g002887 [Trifolium pratense]